jgi:hypothetical protein
MAKVFHAFSSMLTYDYILTDLMRNKAWVRTGRSYTVYNPRDLDERVTLTGFLTLDPDARHPVELVMNRDTNDAETFVNNVRDVAATGFFRPGDFFLMDNASIHVQSVCLRCSLLTYSVVRRICSRS